MYEIRMECSPKVSSQGGACANGETHRKDWTPRTALTTSEEERRVLPHSSDPRVSEPVTLQIPVVDMSPRRGIMAVVRSEAAWRSSAKGSCSCSATSRVTALN